MEKDRLNLVNLEESCIFVTPQKHPNKERYFKKEILQTVIYWCGNINRYHSEIN